MIRGVWYTAGALAAAAVVGLLGASLAGADSGVWTGVAIGTVVQVAGFWAFSVWLLPGQPVLAHGLGLLMRLLTVGLVALLWLPRAPVTPAPTLFALVGVFFLTMLVEPIVLKIGSRGTGDPAAQAVLTRDDS